MGGFIAELKRRHIYRIAAAYAVVAWAALQLVNNVAPGLNLPGWAVSLVIVLLGIGFPIALVFAWSLELKAKDAPSPTGASDWVLAAVALAFIGMFAYQQLLPSRATVTAEPGVEAARQAAASPATAISVAVMPFANLSTDKDQEFFSDGMTEDIVTALSKIPDLRVVARESASQYKGEKNDMRAVGRALNATHLIEGSVRKAGTRIRITAQLVNAEDGVNIWAESYDRDLTDIFALQEDIARAIATSLRMPLGLRPGENLVSNRNIDIARYQQFLALRAQIRALNNQATREKVLPELEKLVTEDPAFAPGWAELSRLYFSIQNPVYFTIWTRPPEETRRLFQSGYEKSEKAAREAIRLDPRQAYAYSNLAVIEEHRQHWTEAEELIRKALEANPSDPDVLYSKAQFLFGVGRLKEAIQVAEQAHALEPLVPGYAAGLAATQMAGGQVTAALATFESLSPRTGTQHASLAHAYALTGRFDDAAAQLLRTANRNQFGPGQVEAAARLIRGAPDKVKDPSSLPAFEGSLDWVYAYVGAPERLLDFPERALQAGEIGFPGPFLSNYAPVRKTERFKKLVREAGLVEYWKARGWPDMCHPTTGDDFACE